MVSVLLVFLVLLVVSVMDAFRNGMPASGTHGSVRTMLRVEETPRDWAQWHSPP